MYNEEQKTRFIREYTQSISTAQNATMLFNIFEPYEVEWEADLCTRTAEELQPVVNKVIGVRYHSRWTALSILKEYTRWCQKLGIKDAKDGISNVNLDGLDNIRTKMVSSPLHLQVYLDSIFDAEDEETIDNVYRCYYWMAYAGIDEEDTLHITNDDVDLENMEIRYGELRVPIYREAIPVFRNVINLSSFNHKHPGYFKPIRRDRVVGNEIMRGVKANPKLSTIRTTLSAKSKEAISRGTTKQQLSFKRIMLSGIFYRVYEQERATRQIDFSDAAIRFMAGKTYKTRTENTKKNMVEREYMEDYQRWKLAFSV